MTTKKNVSQKRERVQETASAIEESQISEAKQELESLSNNLLMTTQSIQKQSEFNELKASIFQLNNSIQNLQTSTKTYYPITHEKEKGCGCNDEKQCCVQLFISRVRVLKAQNLGDADKLELIFAVRALDMCGLLPGLTSYLKIDKDAGWIPAYSPIGKFCVSCNGKMTIPLTVEAMETGERGEGRPEYGSSPSSITISCNCEIIPVQIPVSLSGGGVGKGQVEVEVSARKINGGCC